MSEDHDCYTINQCVDAVKIFAQLSHRKRLLLFRTIWVLFDMDKEPGPKALKPPAVRAVAP